jgi:hypothetical protein
MLSGCGVEKGEQHKFRITKSTGICPGDSYNELAADLDTMVVPLVENSQREVCPIEPNGRPTVLIITAAYDYYEDKVTNLTFENKLSIPVTVSMQIELGQRLDGNFLNQVVNNLPSEEIVIAPNDSYTIAQNAKEGDRWYGKLGFTSTEGSGIYWFENDK